MSILHGWKPRLGKGLNLFRNTLNNQQLALVNTPTEITLEGTPFSPEIMNELEQAIANSAILAFDAAPTSSTPGAVGQFGAYDGMIYYCTKAEISMTYGAIEAGTYFFYAQNLPRSFTLDAAQTGLAFDGATLTAGGAAVTTHEWPQGTKLNMTDASAYSWRALEPAASTVPIPDTLAAELGLPNDSTVADALAQLNAAKAPTAHASAGTAYGLGTSALYGHCQIVDDLTQSANANGKALSAHQGYVLSSKFNNYLPLSGGTLTGAVTSKSHLTANGQNANGYSVVCQGGVWTNTKLHGTTLEIESYNSIYASNKYLVLTAPADRTVTCRSDADLNVPIAITASAFTQMSSRDVKENIRALTEEDAKAVLNLTPVHFDYKESVGGQKDQLGLIAEDVAEVIPQVVFTTEGAPPSIDYSKLVPHLIKLVQVQQARIDALAARLDAAGV